MVALANSKLKKIKKCHKFEAYASAAILNFILCILNFIQILYFELNFWGVKGDVRELKSKILQISKQFRPICLAQTRLV